ncbi:MAG: hypothetical protein Q4D98_03365 [Planctomycetia bacterium]|nr:hypothetical protein [Planctomycetia bacterium]
MEKRLWVLEALLIFAAFALFGAYAVPDVNEAHYLGKAAFFWNPDYAPNDFFLSSPDAHAVFYLSFGWLTRCFDINTVAWIGRVLTWLLLAAGWLSMTRAILGKWGMGLFSALVFLTVQSRFSFAGEWVVGGVEAKGFAFALMFFGLGAWFRGHWNRCWVLLGCSAMFHVLVGGWAILGVGVSWLILRNYGGDREAPKLVSMLPWLTLAFLLSLPALVPALLLNRDVPSQAVEIADKLYVFERLPHHLLLSFIAQRTPDKLIYFGGLFLIWSYLACRPRFSDADMRLRTFVYASLMFMACGWGINLFLNTHPATVAALLRFYWFRLVDVTLPMGVAVVGVLFCSQTTMPGDRNWKLRRGILTAALLFLACLAMTDSLRRLAQNAPPRSCSGAAKYTDWLALCDYVKNNTEPADIFAVPYTTRTFTWYTNRPVVGVWKDIPQDASHLVAWWNRMQMQYYGLDLTSPVHAYGRLRSFGLLPRERFGKMKERYQVKYVVSVKGDFPEKPVYENGAFGLWKIEDLMENK